MSRLDFSIGAKHRDCRNHPARHMHLGLFAVLRFMERRQAGNFGPADLLVIVLIADAA
jgi:hypothetical protein